MTKTYSYSAENDEFIDMTQNNYFIGEEDCKIFYFNNDKNEFYEFVNSVELKNEKNKLTNE
jgi:hypothetical protein